MPTIVIPIQFIIALVLGAIGIVLLIIVHLIEWIRKTIKELKEKK